MCLLDKVTDRLQLPSVVSHDWELDTREELLRVCARIQLGGEHRNIWNQGLSQ